MKPKISSLFTIILIFGAAFVMSPVIAADASSTQVIQFATNQTTLTSSGDIILTVSPLAAGDSIIIGTSSIELNAGGNPSPPTYSTPSDNLAGVTISSCSIFQGFTSGTGVIAGAEVCLTSGSVNTGGSTQITIHFTESQVGTTGQINSYLYEVSNIDRAHPDIFTQGNPVSPTAQTFGNPVKPSANSFVMTVLMTGGSFCPYSSSDSHFTIVTASCLPNFGASMYSTSFDGNTFTTAPLTTSGAWVNNFAPSPDMGGASDDTYFIVGFPTTAVTKSATSTSVSCNPGSVAVNQPTICTATVTDTSSTPTTPTGTVSFSSSSSGSFSPSATCTLSPTSSSTSTCSVSYTPNPGTEGAQTITGTYSGDSTHQGSTGSFSLTVTQRTTTTSLSCSPTAIEDFHSTTCTATVTDTSPGTQITPTGTVSWSSNGPGTFSSTTCTLSGTGGTAKCNVTFTSMPGKPSIITITGTYGGDADHSGSSGSTTIIHR